MSNICNKSVTDRLLGCLIKQPNLCLDSRYKLTSEEFEYTSKFSAIMFVVINNLASNGTQTITLLDVNAFLEPYEAQYNIYKDNNGDDYISLISSITAEDNFESYYNEFKKLSLLNTYYSNKFDISKFWDFEKSDDKNYEILNQYSIKDIIDSYDAVQESVKLNYSSSILKQLKCGDGFEDVKELFKETPYFGAVMESPIQTTLYRGWCRGHLLLRSAPSGFGKAQPVDTIIPTPNGNTRIGDIKVGDYVFDRFGKPTKVLGVYPQGVIDNYKITFKDGRTTYCNGEHLWNIYYKQGRSYYKKDMKTITTLEAMDLMYNKHRVVNIPMCEAVEYSEKHFDIDPYVIGSLLGNGCLTLPDLTYSSNDLEQVEEVARLLGATPFKRKGDNYNWVFKLPERQSEVLNGRVVYSNYIKSRILNKYRDDMLVHSHEKRIPREYMYGSIEQRYALLQGLLDTDGSISTSDRHHVTFSTSSEQLARDVAELVWSLGYSANPKCYKRHESDARVRIHGEYTVTINMPNKDKYKVFRLSRKVERAMLAYNDERQQRRHYDRISMKSIERCGTSEMVCLYVENEEHLFLTNDYLVTHNTILSVGELCNVCATKIYDYKKEAFVPNPNYQGCGGLFINTEMDLDTELVPMFVAYVSGVSRGSIMDGKYDYGEEARVDKAIEILHDSNIYLVDDPKFTLNSLENTIKDHVLNHNVGYVVMDYLQDNGIIGKEMHKTHEVIARDTIILNMAEELKTWARMYNVGIYTSTQLMVMKRLTILLTKLVCRVVKPLRTR